jgi:hypothetical protein
MKKHAHARAGFAALAVALAMSGFAFGQRAYADPPPWAGSGAEGRYPGDRYDSRYDRHSPEYRKYSREQQPYNDYRYAGPPIDFRFDDHARGAVHGYYGERFRRGDCPRGLAKKRNGCAPPGHDRLWQRGYPLPPGIAYYGLPPALLGRLPPPPPGHRYVRVASDILLIAIGSALVIDAIEDIGRY